MTPSSSSYQAALLLLTVAALHGCSSTPRDEAIRPEPAAHAPGARAIGMAPTAPDPFGWLEEIDSDRSLAWVRERNQASYDAFAESALFDSLYAEALAALNSAERLPNVTQRGAWLYNLWRDADHPRGLYRRTTLDQLRSDQPRWHTVLDIDSLSEAEGTQWVFHGMSCLPPEHRRCLVRLSPGGTDADEVREWDMATMSFVDDGFFLPVAKTNVSWRDENTVYVGTDFGPGSMTTSGYARIAKLWRRGTPIGEAVTLHEGDAASVSVSATRIRTDAGDIDLVGEGTSFWETRRWLLEDGRLTPLDLPVTASVVDGWMGRLVVYLNAAWERDGTTYPEGTLLLAHPDALRGAGGRVEVIFQPGAGVVMVPGGAEATPLGILVSVLEDVRARVYLYRPGAPIGGALRAWTRTPVPFPDHGAISIGSVDEESGDFFATYESFTTPPTLYHVDLSTLEPAVVRQQPPTFDGSRFEVTQHWAESADGTRVPYFMVAPRGIPLDGSNPTHIFSYGGFRNALTPSYSGSYEPHQGAYGRLWLERGGVFVLANIRGGGEFGPAWHAAALRENRPRAFEDFEAIAEDLVARGVTTPDRLGIEGRSNGGLLVLATMARRPELYGAVIAGVPLSDMARYHRLLAGASWMAEFGDPDVPEDWAFLRTYSPYQNLEHGVDYPHVLFYGSTRDDRVHPAHARKTAALLESIGSPVYFYENIEGGHGGSATNEQLAYRIALSYAYLWHVLGRPAREAT